MKFLWKRLSCLGPTPIIEKGVEEDIDRLCQLIEKAAKTV